MSDFDYKERMSEVVRFHKEQYGLDLNCGCVNSFICNICQQKLGVDGCLELGRLRCSREVTFVLDKFEDI